jgi:hypothetical protein
MLGLEVAVMAALLGFPRNRHQTSQAVATDGRGAAGTAKLSIHIPYSTGVYASHMEVNPSTENTCTTSSVVLQAPTTWTSTYPEQVIPYQNCTPEISSMFLQCFASYGPLVLSCRIMRLVSLSCDARDHACMTLR